MHSVLFVRHGNIECLGPFATEVDADEAARKLVTVDPVCTNVYYLGPKHELVAYSLQKLLLDDDNA